MNKYVFAVCGIFCNVAMAQSSVTVYGVADAALVKESGGVAGGGDRAFNVGMRHSF
ncbi:porin [Massilia sp. DJPM01]|uniref:porin n=1 Tax=Massilia sp. DJPM01 TaxID=3024404 RepID=UPI00259D574B|nr:porin [Massilia sp. DJPM01]MDM5180462.1 porin [Massilia sp. DJPM01]